MSTLDYARNRYYSSTLARFTTPDPFAGSARPGNPQSWNRYSYVQNDPVNFLDPAGFAKCPPGSEATCIDVVASSLDVDPLASAFRGLLSMRFKVPFELERLPEDAYPEEPEPEPDPECFAQLKYRNVDHPIARLLGATHAFWWVQSRTGEDYIISAGPTLAEGGTARYLEAWVQQGDSNGKGNSSQTLAWSSGLSSLNCD